MARTRAQATPRRSPRIKRIQNQRSQQLANTRSTADRNVSNRETSRRNRRSGRLIDLTRSDPPRRASSPIWWRGNPIDDNPSGVLINSRNRRSTAAERLASRLDLSRQFYRGLVDRHQIEAEDSIHINDSQRQITNDAGTNVTISQLQTATVNATRQETNRDESDAVSDRSRSGRSNRRLAVPQQISLTSFQRASLNTSQPQVEQSPSFPAIPSSFPFLSRNIRPRPAISNAVARSTPPTAVRTLPRPISARHPVANQTNGGFVFRDPLRPAGSLSFHIHPPTVDLSNASNEESNADPRIQFDADELQRLFWRDIFSLDILNLESRSLGMTTEQINSIQTKAFKSTRSSRHESCHVCLLDFENNELLKRLPKCGHEFHVDCLKPWLEKHTTCPVCRESVLKN